MSPANAPVFRSLWETRPDRGSVLGITGFGFDVATNAEDRFLNNLDSIDLHHGPHSTDVPYRELEAVGVALTANIRRVLSQIGFYQFTEGEEGFVARRSKEERAAYAFDCRQQPAGAAPPLKSASMR